METDAEAIAEIRAFNRFYTGRLGLLEETHLESGFTLTEVRVLYELAQRDGLTASDLCRELRLDPGYCSRLVRRFTRAGLVARSGKPGDGRSVVLALTEAGRRAFAPLDTGARRQVGAMLETLGAAERERVVRALRTVRWLLGGEAAAGLVLRPLGVGDLGWIVHRHGVLYASEYGLDASFEALVAEIAAAFVRRHDPAREGAWVAEVGGEIAGSVFVVSADAETAKLRLLYVEPSMRGGGVGARLVAEAVAFARAAGYARMTLWTNDVLTAARRLYERAGFRLVASEPHRSFGRDLVGETWELALGAPQAATP